MVADKNTGRGITTFKSSISGIMDLKLMNQASQRSKNSMTSVCTQISLLLQKCKDIFSCLGIIHSRQLYASILVTIRIGING